MPPSHVATALLLLGACTGQVEVDTCVPTEEIPYDHIDQDCDGADLTDRDGDGYDAQRSGGDDCDDGNKWVHPGAEETCDGVDEDCDTEVDEDAVDALTWYADHDHDGWGSDEEIYVACEKEAVWWTDRGGDCDDDENRVAPGLDERCDGVDEDCDGEVDEDPVDGQYLHRDDDGDGWGAEEAHLSCPGEGWVDAGGDCDDADAGVNPDQLELCDDGVDQDCDGTPIGCGPWGEINVQTHADARVEGESYTGNLGSWPSVVDADGDGVGDLLLAEAAPYNGSVYLIHGPISATTYQATTDAELAVVGEWGGVREIGHAQAGADLDGDGGDELVLGCWTCDDNRGAVFVVDASQTGTLSPEDLDVSLTGISDGDMAGWDVADVGDTDGDGYEDLLVGAKSVDEITHNQGAAYLVLGPVEEELSLADADATFMVESTRAAVGEAVGASQDLDGDGAVDLLVGASGLESLFVVPTPVEGAVDLTTAVAVLGEDGALGRRGTFSARDLGSDGVDELLVGQPFEDGGKAYLFTGPIGTGWTLSDASLVFVGDKGSQLGDQVLLPGDMDHDGHGEMVLYAADSYEVLLFRGPPPAATAGPSGADGILTSVNGVGTPLGAGDVTDNDRSDLLVGITGDLMIHEGHGSERAPEPP